MRKLTMLVAVLGLAILMASPCVAKVLLSEGFEGYEVGAFPPDPWAPFVRAEADAEMFNVDNTRAFEGSNSFHVQQASNWASSGALFESDARIISYELYAYTELSDVRTLIMIMANEGMEADNDDVKANYVAFRSTGSVEYHDGAWHPVAAFQTGVWHHVACEIDLDAQTYKIFLDDMTNPVAVDCNFWHPVEKLVYAVLRVSPTGGEYWADNLFVYEGPIGSEVATAVDSMDKIAATWGSLKVSH